MYFSWKFFFISLIIFVVFTFISSLISYYLSKWLAKWIKNVQRIDNRKDLNKSPKLKEIVRVIREVSKTYKIKMPEVGVYPSNEVNAFATGPSNNTLIAFSSGLINIMNLEEIKGVIGHELSHIINYDLKRILLVQGIFDVLYFCFSFLFSYWLFSENENDKRNKKESKEIIRLVVKYIFFYLITTFMRLIGILIIFWYNRKRELVADEKGAEIAGIDSMIASLRKLLELENKSWIVDGIDLTEDENLQQGEPNSISLLKFNPEKKKRGLLDLLRTHPTLEYRIERLEKLKKKLKIKSKTI